MPTTSSEKNPHPEPHRTRRVALVTGGSRGIGLGIATELARAGWDLAINGMRPAEQTTDAVRHLEQLGARVAYCLGNVADPLDRQRIVADVERHFGALHLLVNNAGITSPGRRDLLEAEEEGFWQVMGVNLQGAWLMAQACAHKMLDQRRRDPQFRGAIINISSVSAEVVSTNRGDYCLARALLSAATLHWARQLESQGIAVYEIRPGIIRTDMTAGVSDKYDRLIAAGLTAQRRWGEPSDVGRAAAALADPQATYATGSLVLVDGGLTRLRSL